ncbi:MAG TPA: phosphate ABC transporter substrate-binding protein PstS [Polyangiaceae bacterium]|jgi:phosphate transport system substrate-binding protein|nr:phosphate ABC transporter substrate-binding protein PstS [Polyangiaceae bacterium]
MKDFSIVTWVLAGLSLVAVGCKGGSDQGAPQAAASGAAASEPAKPTTTSLNGAGATFPNALYSKWTSEYNKLHPDVQINYQPIGSGGGIAKIRDKTVDFGATDSPMSNEEAAKAPGKLVHLPMTIGAVAIAYNVPEVADLKLEPAALADIYLGTVTKWNDPKIAASNAGTKLPATPIVVVHRSDGSGTTAVFTGYLSKSSKDWTDKVGAGKSVKWPAGQGMPGNPGVTGRVKDSPGAIGYVDLADAVQNKLSMASLKNPAGKFVKPEIAAISAAAAGVEMPDTLYTSIINAPGETAYPISSFTYILVYEDMPDAAKGKVLTTYLWWAVHDGQNMSEALNYAPLPSAVVGKVEARLRTLHSGATVLYSGT